MSEGDARRDDAPDKQHVVVTIEHSHRCRNDIVFERWIAEEAWVGSRGMQPLQHAQAGQFVRMRAERQFRFDARRAAEPGDGGERDDEKAR